MVAPLFVTLFVIVTAATGDRVQCVDIIRAREAAVMFSACALWRFRWTPIYPEFS